MKTKVKEVYYCEHCKKHGLNRLAMAHHELICSNNPDNNRPCFHCQHLTKKQTSIFEDYQGQSHEIFVSLLHCNAKQMFLYTPQNEIKGNQFDLGDEINEPMPRECVRYEERKDIF